MKQAAGNVCLGLGGENRVGGLEVDGVGVNRIFREGINIATHELFIGFDGYLKGHVLLGVSHWFVNVSLSNRLVSRHMKSVGRRKGT